MATSNGFPPPGTCHTDLSVEKKEDRELICTWDLPGTKRQMRGGNTRHKASPGVGGNICGNDSTIHAPGDHHPLAYNSD